MAGERYIIERYGSHWAVYDGAEDKRLLGVTLYRKGAAAIAFELASRDAEIQALKAMQPEGIINDLRETNRRLRYADFHNQYS